MSRILTIANHKGGTAKTTTCANLSVALTELGKKVLAVDLDPQAGLSTSLGADVTNLEKNVYHAMLEKNTNLADVLVRVRENLDLAPAGRDLAAAEMVLVTEANGELALTTALRGVKDKYDFILLDCPPSLGKLTINALVAADEVIIPVQCSFLAVRPLGQLLDTISLVREKLNSNLKIGGILLTRFDSRTLHAKEVVERIREIFKDKVFNTVVSASVRFDEAPVRGESILEYAKDHKGAAAYRELTKEVISRG